MLTTPLWCAHHRIPDRFPTQSSSKLGTRASVEKDRCSLKEMDAMMQSTFLEWSLSYKCWILIHLPNQFHVNNQEMINIIPLFPVTRRFQVSPHRHRPHLKRLALRSHFRFLGDAVPRLAACYHHTELDATGKDMEEKHIKLICLNQMVLHLHSYFLPKTCGTCYCILVKAS